MPPLLYGELCLFFVALIVIILYKGAPTTFLLYCLEVLCPSGLLNLNF